MEDVIIIGGGVAGLACARELAKQNLRITVIEKSDTIGGHVGYWSECFPFEMTGTELVEKLKDDRVKILKNTAIEKIDKEEDHFRINALKSKSVVVATGFNLFDATIKEELGYGVYPHVITSEELENAWRENRLPFDTKGVDNPRFAIVHCVGSRDLKCNISHCSKVCCMVGTKAARELKRAYPNCQVTNFYMDLRMFDTGYEELYHEAQTLYNIQFVRGRISEISHGNQGRIKLKAEDTLLGVPVADRVHGVVLMVGMQPTKPLLVNNLPLKVNPNGFLEITEKVDANRTTEAGIFIAGTCKGPKTITETLADGKVAAMEVIEYLKTKK